MKPSSLVGHNWPVRQITWSVSCFVLACIFLFCVPTELKGSSLHSGTDDHLFHTWGVEGDRIVFWFRGETEEFVNHEKLVKETLGEAESKLISPVISGDRAILSSAKFLKNEIELSTAQLNELKKAQQQFDSNFRELAEGLRSEKTTRKRRRLINVFIMSNSGKAKSILLPHQLAVIKSVRLQNLIYERGIVEALTDSELTEQLKISKPRREKLEKRSTELIEQFCDEFDELIFESRKEMLSVLTEKQRTKLQDLTGPPSVTENQSFRQTVKGWLKF